MTTSALAVDAGDVVLQAYVHAADGLPAGAPTVVAVHGYPDTHLVWEPVAADLSRDHRVISYDVRGAGGSAPPATGEGYRTERLVDDLVAVLDSVAPGEAVHLLGHDWGSCQLWDAVCAEEHDPRLTGRIASYTSISGPSLDHLAAFVRRAPAEAVRDQRRRSWYVRAFHLPLLPELVWRGLTPVLRRVLARQEGLGGRGHWGPTLGRDGARGLGLYRANVRPRLRSPGPGTTRVPVLLVVPLRDRYIAPASLAYVADAVPRLERVEVDAGHWLPHTDPERVAGLVRGHVTRHAAAGG